jgi:hypothetical protein
LLNNAVPGAADHRLVIYFGRIPREDRHEEEIKSAERLMGNQVSFLGQQIAAGAGKEKRKFFIPGIRRRLAAGFERFLLARLHCRQADFDRPAGCGLNKKRSVQLAGEGGAGDFMHRPPLPRGRGGFGHDTGWKRQSRRQQGGAIKQELSARGQAWKSGGNWAFYVIADNSNKTSERGNYPHCAGDVKFYCI